MGKLYLFTWVGRYQKGKTNLDFTKARDSDGSGTWHAKGESKVTF